MIHHIFWTLLAFGAVQPPATPPSPPPDTEIFVAPLSSDTNGSTIGRPTNITNSPGYDNQPSFTPNGSILFTSIRGGTQTDIYGCGASPRKAVSRATIDNAECGLRIADWIADRGLRIAGLECGFN